MMARVFIKLVIRVNDNAVETGQPSQNDGKTIRLSWQITGFNSQVQTSSYTETSPTQTFL